MKKETEDVLEFHNKFEAYVGKTIGPPTNEIAAFRRMLILEEAHETLDAMLDGDTEEVLDGIVDTIYVLLGAGLAWGFTPELLEQAWDEVHRSNMAKTGGRTRGDGKVLKPKNWQPPDITGLIKTAREKE